MDAQCVSKCPTGGQLHQPTKDLKKYFDTYNMTHKKRGIAYIFNNVHFKDMNLKTRNGSVKDEKDFKTALIKVGFHENDINVYRDSNVKEIFNALEQFEKDNLHIDIDCFICAILSHGDTNDRICGYDSTFKLDELLSCLRPDRCPSLIGIPKLFFIQACRGTTPDYGVEKCDADPIEPEARSPTIPIMADFLIVYSSCNKYSSYRDESDGSVFMQAVSDILMEYGYKYDIMKLITAVSNRVASLDLQNLDNSDYKIRKQMPQIMSTLIKELKFEQKN